jgi:hypothetical protein
MKIQFQKIIFLAIAALSIISSPNSFSSVPTEEGLLRNLNNADLPGQFITLKTMVQTAGYANKVITDQEKTDYVKFLISLENSPIISLVQITYSSAQMLNTQIKSVKYVPDLLGQIKREKVPEKSLFYSILMMLTSNRSQGVEAFLEKNGTAIVKNRTILNEDKIRLLKAYRSFLINNKGRGDAGSPLNPEDPKNKERILSLFRSNTFKRAQNIELVKKENEFMWKVDWKSAQGFFSNEERHFRAIEYNTGEAQIDMTAAQYTLFNGTNELPKYMSFKDSTGRLFKMQVLGMDNKLKADKRLVDTFLELKKIPTQEDTTYTFLF